VLKYLSSQIQIFSFVSGEQQRHAQQSLAPVSEASREKLRGQHNQQRLKHPVSFASAHDLPGYSDRGTGHGSTGADLHPYVDI
jgi:hypothetical protein